MSLVPPAAVLSLGFTLKVVAGPAAPCFTVRSCSTTMDRISCRPGKPFSCSLFPFWLAAQAWGKLSTNRRLFIASSSRVRAAAQRTRDLSRVAVRRDVLHVPRSPSAVDEGLHLRRREAVHDVERGDGDRRGPQDGLRRRHYP